MAEPGQGRDADRLAAEWAAMATHGPEAEAEPASEEPAASERILNQNEIDALLGFGAEEASGAAHAGIRAIIDQAMVAYERLPMLEVIFDRLVRAMATSLRNFTSDNVDVSVDTITAIRSGDYLNSLPLPVMLGVFKAEQWDNCGLLAIDSALVYSIVDVLLGGRRGTAPLRIEGRPFTTIERGLIERFMALVLADLSAAFQTVSPVRFGLDRLETNPRFAGIGRPANAAVLVRLRVDMEDRGGRLEVLLPYATLEPVREILLQDFSGEKFGRDSIWEAHLASELWDTQVAVAAVLDRVEMPLGEVLGLKVGSHIPLTVAAQSPVKLMCGDVPVFRGKLGRRGAKVAIRIDDVLDLGPGERQ